MDTATIAQQTVEHLVPVLPFLLDAGHGAAKKVGEVLTQNALDFAHRLWTPIQSRAETSQPTLLEAAKEAVANPTDNDVRGALRLQLRKLLEKQPALQDELRNILVFASTQQNNTTASGTGAITVGGSVSSSTLSTNVQR